MSAIKYLDMLENRFNWSDYKIAKELGVTRGAISNIRQEKTSCLSDDLAIKIARLLELDELQVVAEQHAEREKNKDVKAFWKKLSGAAVIIFCLTFQPQYVDAAGLNGNLTNDSLTIMRNVARSVKAAVDKMARFLNSIMSACKRQTIINTYG